MLQTTKNGWIYNPQGKKYASNNTSDFSNGILWLINSTFNMGWVASTETARREETSHSYTTTGYKGTTFTAGTKHNDYKGTSSTDTNPSDKVG